MRAMPPYAQPRLLSHALLLQLLLLSPPARPVSCQAAPPLLDQPLLHAVYSSTFRLKDGSTLAGVDGSALHAMRGNLQRLLAAENATEPLLPLARSLPDDRLLAILLLAVAGNFTVDQSPSALQQQCGIVIDGGTGALVLRDSSATQSVILEVLLIVSILCLLRAWGEAPGPTGP
jgi:hypothetical protein